MNTGRSFFAATADLGPKGFWPCWAVITILVAGWPAWMGGAVIAAQQFTGISTQTLLPGSLPPQYIWAVIALVLVLVVFYLSDRTYKFLERFFLFIMWANIILVVVITAIAAKPHHYWDVLMGMLGITFLTQGGYPAQLPLTDALALFGQPGGSIMYVSFWVIAAGFAMGKFAGQAGPLRPPSISPPRRCGGTRTTPPSAARCTSGSSWVATACSSGGASSAASSWSTSTP